MNRKTVQYSSIPIYKNEKNKSFIIINQNQDDKSKKKQSMIITNSKIDLLEEEIEENHQFSNKRERLQSVFENNKVRNSVLLGKFNENLNKILTQNKTNEKKSKFTSKRSFKDYNLYKDDNKKAKYKDLNIKSSDPNKETGLIEIRDLTPIPKINKVIEISNQVKEKFQKAERFAVHLRRLQYSFNKKKYKLNEEHIMFISAKIIQKWWRVGRAQMRFFIKIQSCFRGFMMRKRYEEHLYLLDNYITSINVFTVLIKKTILKTILRFMMMRKLYKKLKKIIKNKNFSLYIIFKRLLISLMKISKLKKTITKLQTCIDLSTKRRVINKIISRNYSYYCLDKCFFLIMKIFFNKLHSKMKNYLKFLVFNRIYTILNSRLGLYNYEVFFFLKKKSLLKKILTLTGSERKINIKKYVSYENILQLYKRIIYKSAIEEIIKMTKMSSNILIKYKKESYNQFISSVLLYNKSSSLMKIITTINSSFVKNSNKFESNDYIKLLQSKFIYSLYKISINTLQKTCFIYKKYIYSLYRLLSVIKNIVCKRYFKYILLKKKRKKYIKRILKTYSSLSFHQKNKKNFEFKTYEIKLVKDTYISMFTEFEYGKIHDNYRYYREYKKISQLYFTIYKIIHKKFFLKLKKNIQKFYICNQVSICYTDSTNILYNINHIQDNKTIRKTKSLLNSYKNLIIIKNPSQELILNYNFQVKKLLKRYFLLKISTNMKLFSVSNKKNEDLMNIIRKIGLYLKINQLTFLKMIIYLWYTYINVLNLKTYKKEMKNRFFNIESILKKRVVGVNDVHYDNRYEYDYDSNYSFFNDQSIFNFLHSTISSFYSKSECIRKDDNDNDNNHESDSDI